MRLRRGAVGLCLFGLVLAQTVRVTAVPTNYYVSNSTGSDARSCATASNLATPKLTISAGMACAIAGDTVNIDGDTYTGTTNRIDSQVYTVASGTDFLTGAITVKPYAGETVIIKPPDNQPAIRLTTGAPHYLIFQDLILDMDNGTLAGAEGGADGVYVGSGAHHNRFLRLEVKNNSANGFQFSDSSGNSPFNEVQHCNIHTNGQSLADPHGLGPGGINNGYGLYVFTSDNLFEYNDIHDNGGYGFHLYNNGGPQNVARNIVRFNHYYSNGSHGGTNYAQAIAWGADNQFYGNILNGNRGGLLVYSNSANTLVAQNTIYNNSPFEGIALQYYASAPTVTNNIVYSNGSGIVDYGGTGSPVLAGNVTSNPWATPPTTDFSLAVGSSALNIGACPTGLAADIIGTFRPQGASCDAGAYELSVGSPSIPVVATMTLIVGQKTVVYTDFACAGSGTPPYLWDVSSGSLPTGLSLSTTTSTCVTVSGTPSAAAISSVTLRVTDSAAQAGTQAYTLTIVDVSPCVWTSGSWTAIACAGASSADGSAAATTSAINTTGADLIGCAVADENAETATPFADSKGNTWSLAGTAAMSEYGRLRVLYSRPTSVGAGHTFAATPPATLNYPAVACVAFSGSKVSPFDQVGAGTSGLAATSLSGGSVVTTAAGNISLAGLIQEQNNVVALAGYTVFQRLFSFNRSYGVALGWAVLSSPSTTAPAWSWASAMSAGAYPATFQAFVPAAATPGPSGGMQGRHRKRGR